MTNIRDLVNTYQALQTLNVSSESSFDEIKVAYRKLALEFHPDKNTGEQEGIQFKKITELLLERTQNSNQRPNSLLKSWI